MKKKVIMAGAAVIMSAVAVGFSANTNNNMTDLMSANLEALTDTEHNGVRVYQTMAWCYGEMRLACTTKQYADDCMEGYCVVNY